MVSISCYALHAYGHPVHAIHTYVGLLVLALLNFLLSVATLGWKVRLNYEQAH